MSTFQKVKVVLFISFALMVSISFCTMFVMEAIQ